MILSTLRFTVILLLLFSLRVYSQTNDEGLSFLQFNFLNPGARSLAMGGAFVGMADDSTAALANPAGLIHLRRKEISVEYGGNRYRNQIPWHDGELRFQSEIHGDRLEAFNFDFDFRPKNFPATVQDISFGSFVYPVQKDKFVLSVFYHQQANFKREFTTQGFDYCNQEGRCEPDVRRVVSTFDFDIRNVGISASFRPVEGLSLGGTLNYSQLEGDSTTTRLTDDGLSSHNIEEFDALDRKLSFTLGLLRRESKYLDIGAVYARRPKYNITSSFLQLYNAPPPGFLFGKNDHHFKTPDSYAVGLSLKPDDSFRLNFDVVRVLYSQLMDGYYNVFLVSFPAQSAAFFTSPEFFKDKLEVKDGTEIRFGVEYKHRKFATRAGYWREPFHGMVRKESDSSIIVIDDNSSDPNNKFAFPDQISPFVSREFIQDYNHYSAGAGILFDRFTIEFAYDYSQNFQRFNLSSILYFGYQ